MYSLVLIILLTDYLLNIIFVCGFFPEREIPSEKEAKEEKKILITSGYKNN